MNPEKSVAKPNEPTLQESAKRSLDSLEDYFSDVPAKKIATENKVLLAMVNDSEETYSPFTCSVDGFHLKSMIADLLDFFVIEKDGKRFDRLFGKELSDEHYAEIVNDPVRALPLHGGKTLSFYGSFAFSTLNRNRIMDLAAISYNKTLAALHANEEALDREPLPPFYLLMNTNLFLMGKIKTYALQSVCLSAIFRNFQVYRCLFFVEQQELPGCKIYSG